MSENNDKEIEISEEKQLQKARSSRRIFYLFVVIDILLAGIVLYEIIEIIRAAIGTI
ncbi:MAG: hypothetical protein WC344_04460 [Bacilli bacterium]|jgi:hypothetical protein